MIGDALTSFFVITGRRHGNLKESQNSKIKMQNDRAKMKKQSVISSQRVAEG